MTADARDAYNGQKKSLQCQYITDGKRGQF